MSSILFNLYTSSLFQEIESTNLRVNTLGFADDINLLAYSRSTEVNCKALERTHKLCLDWASKHGMDFNPTKYTLIHFTRTRTKFNTKASVQLGLNRIQPSKEVRVLGVQLDPKLNWKAHSQKIKRKLDIQLLALTRITASTWGPSLAHARQIYLATIRSALAHGAPAWHIATKTKKGNPRGLAIGLIKTQNQCLRVVTGAFKAVATRRLETEAFIPPLDLWLDSRVAKCLTKANK